jgi:hypothetical protein
MPAARSASDAPAKPRSDAYVGLLGLSLLALSAAILFAFLNWDTIKEKPPQVKMAPVGGGGAGPGALPVRGPAQNPQVPPANVNPQPNNPPPNNPPPNNPPQKNK